MAAQLNIHWQDCGIVFNQICQPNLPIILGYISLSVKIGPETAEEIGHKREKCPRLPVSVLSLFIV